MSDEFLEYAKLHLISLEQDREMTTEEDLYNFYDGGVEATAHLLTVYADLLYNGEKEGN